MRPLSNSTIQLNSSGQCEEVQSSFYVSSVAATLCLAVTSPTGLESDVYQSQASELYLSRYKDRVVYEGSSRHGWLAALTPLAYQLKTRDESWATMKKFARKMLASQHDVPEEFESVFQKVFWDVLA